MRVAHYRSGLKIDIFLLSIFVPWILHPDFHALYRLTLLIDDYAAD